MVPRYTYSSIYIAACAVVVVVVAVSLAASSTPRLSCMVFVEQMGGWMDGWVDGVARVLQRVFRAVPGVCFFIER